MKIDFFMLFSALLIIVRRDNVPKNMLLTTVCPVKIEKARAIYWERVNFEKTAKMQFNLNTFSSKVNSQKQPYQEKYSSYQSSDLGFICSSCSYMTY